MHDSYRKEKRVFLWLYIQLILYIMLFSSGRGYRFDYPHMSFRFTSIPLWFPREWSWRNINLWIFSLGNLLAFAPFGILLPDCYPDILSQYWRSAAVFLQCVIDIELLQFFTRRGVCDLEDIVVNFIGFTIGYVSWKLAYPIEDKGTKAKVCTAFIVGLTCIALVASELINWIFFMDPVRNL